VAVAGLGVAELLISMVSVFRFIDLVATARRASLEEKIALLRRALNLWSGTSLSDVSD